MCLVMVAVVCRWDGSAGEWVELNTEVRVRAGVRAEEREQWADRRHDDHDKMKRCVVVRGYGAVVIVGLGEGGSVNAPPAHEVWCVTL